MAEKVTTMVIKVDLQCSCCLKKIKKILCKFPREIRDQVFDEKQNTVTITVVCCSPEKLRDKLCCKGGKTIKSIEIKEPPKPKAPEKPKDPEKPKAPEKPKEPVKPKEPEKPKPSDKPKEPEKPAPKPKPAPQPTPAPPPPAPQPVYVPVSGYPYPNYPPGTSCCGTCSEGQPGGPCYQGYPRPVPCYDNYGPYGYSYGGSRPYYTSPCQYFREDNPSGCTII